MKENKWNKGKKEVSKRALKLPRGLTIVKFFKLRLYKDYGEEREQ
jgi:hypothetical protein